MTSQGHRQPGHRQTLFTALLITTLLGGCSEPGSDSTLAPQTPVDAHGPSPAVSDSAEGGTTVAVTEGTNLSFALSPDGSQIVLSLQGVLFTLPVAGGSATAVTDYYQDAREPDWSADGSRIVYHGYRQGNWDLWSIAATGGTPVALTTDAFDDREPQYSPDGSQLAFASDRSGNYDIWLMRMSDGQLTQLTDSTMDEYSPAWSNSGAQIAYAGAPSSSSAEVHVIDLATATSQQVATHDGKVNGVSWQPDSQQLTYQLLANAKTSLMSVTVDTREITSTPESAERTLSLPNDDVFPFTAQWTEDSLFYAANGKIYSQPLATNDPATRQVVPFAASFQLRRPSYARRQRDYDDEAQRTALGLAMPALSPDGEQITFSALGDVWLWQPESDALSNLTQSHYVEQTPSWSPDGRRIAYISDQPTANAPNGSVGLWIYDLASQTATPQPLKATGISLPTWSPDGNAIALFTSVPSNPLAGQLVVAKLSDGSIAPVGKPAPAQPISWSADGAYLATTALAPYSGRYREGVYRLRITAADGGEQHEVEPTAHKNMTYAVLAPTGGAMSYVQEGLLWQQSLNESFEPEGEPVALTRSLADTPSWSANGRYVVYMDADKMWKLDVQTGTSTDVTPTINWKQSKPAQSWTLLIGKLFDGVSEDYQENVRLTIKGNRIQSIEPNAEGKPVDVDASDKAAYPGLFEMHAHLGNNSEPQGRTWLAYGVTSVRDPGAHPYVAKERQEMWDSGKSIGPRTHTTGFLTDGNRVYYSIAEGISSEAHLDRALDRTKRLQLDFVKTYVRLPDHWQQKVVEFAHGIGIPTSSHELFPAVAHGMDHVEHIGGTSRRGYAPKVSALGRSYNDVVSLLAQSGMGITPTAVLPGYAVIAKEQPDLFTTPQFEAFYGEAGRQMAAVMSRMFGPRAGPTVTANAQLLRDLQAANALVTSGTDSPFSPFGAGLHAELRLYELAGLSPRDVIRTATLNAAIAVGVADDLGSLQPGKIADLVIVDGDPLENISDADNIVMTIKNGRAYPIEELLETAGVD